MAKKLERAVEALYAEIKKLPPQPRAAIMDRLDAVRVELRAAFDGLIGPSTEAPYPEWMGAPSMRRGGRRKK